MPQSKKQICFVLPHDRENFDETQIVNCALERSFTRAQIHVNDLMEKHYEYFGYVFIEPGEAYFEIIEALIEKNVKILLLGRLSEKILELIGLKGASDLKVKETWSDIEKHSVYDATSKKIIYNRNKSLCAQIGDFERYLCRYDFEREWNIMIR